MSAQTLHQTHKAMVLAVRNCGSWPVAATSIVEFCIAANRAACEVDRSIECWQRWVRRFNPDPNRLELGSTRINVRHEIAKGMLDQRNEAIGLLIGPMGGSA